MKQTSRTYRDALMHAFASMYTLISDGLEELLVMTAHFYHRLLKPGTYAFAASIILTTVLALLSVVFSNPVTVLLLAAGALLRLALATTFNRLSKLLSRDSITTNPVVFSAKLDLSQCKQYEMSAVRSRHESHCVFEDEKGEIVWYVNGVKRDHKEISDHRPTKISDFTKHLQSLGYKDINGAKDIKTSSEQATRLLLDFLTLSTVFILFPVATWNPLLLMFQLSTLRSFITSLTHNWSEIFNARKTFTDHSKNNNWHGHFFLNKQSVTHTPKGVYINGILYDQTAARGPKASSMKIEFSKEWFQHSITVGTLVEDAGGSFVTTAEIELTYQQFEYLYPEIYAEWTSSNNMRGWRKEISEFDMYEQLYNIKGCSEHVFTNLLLNVIIDSRENSALAWLNLISLSSLYFQRIFLKWISYIISTTALFLHPATAPAFASGLSSVIPVVLTFLGISLISQYTSSWFKRLRRTLRARRQPGSVDQECDNYDIHTHLGSIKKRSSLENGVRTSSFTASNPEIQEDRSSEVSVKSNKPYVKLNTGLRTLLAPFTRIYIRTLNHLNLRWGSNTLASPPVANNFIDGALYIMTSSLLVITADLTDLFHPLYAQIYHTIIAPEVDEATAKSIFDELPNLSVQWMRVITNVILTFLVIAYLPSLLSINHLFNTVRIYLKPARVAFLVAIGTQIAESAFTWFKSSYSSFWPSTKAFASTVRQQIIALFKSILGYFSSKRSRPKNNGETVGAEKSSTPATSQHFSGSSATVSRKRNAAAFLKWLPWIKSTKERALSDLRPLIYQLADEGIAKTCRKDVESLQLCIHPDKWPSVPSELIDRVSKYINALIEFKKCQTEYSLFDSARDVSDSYADVCKSAKYLRYSEPQNIDFGTLCPYLSKNISLEDAQRFIEARIYQDERRGENVFSAE